MTDQPNRTALITGGSSGLGFELARQMVAQPPVVIVCGQSQAKLDAAKAQVPQLVASR